MGRKKKRAEDYAHDFEGVVWARAFWDPGFVLLFALLVSGQAGFKRHGGNGGWRREEEEEEEDGKDGLVCPKIATRSPGGLS
ncbi:hypothetical protein HPB47_002936 [Ixodes persulcatus]|uniref:Uncharacterized protein n=1 Tax=Ixodes persulcatus TaxID=34615 RepID=A0AC60PJV6_IXOPE|nr:hypothetical protein HPB47_002936 [Ixodes persulcatus]